MRFIRQRLSIWNISARSLWPVLGGVLLAALAACSPSEKGASNVDSNSQAFQETPPSGQFVEVDGTRVHVRVEGSGPDLILIHGAGGNLRDFTFSMVDKLTNRYRVIAFDRPGHGYTDRIANRAGLGESPAEQAALLSAAASQLGVERAIVAGHSYGGAVTMAWSVNHPQQVAAAVMIAAVSNEWEGDLDSWYTRTTGFFGRNVLLPTLSALASQQRVEDTTKGIFKPDPVPTGYLDHVGLALSKSVVTLQSTTQQVGFLKPHIVAQQARYSQLTLPIEIVHGTADETVPINVHARVLVDQAPNARLTELEGVGHMPHHAAEAEVMAAIDRAAVRAGLR